MDDWTIKSDVSEDFRNIVIPYLSHRFGKKLVGDGNWYSVIDGRLKISAERPTFVSVLGIDEFVRSIMETREFRKGEKIMIEGLKNEAEYIKSTPENRLLARFHKFKCDHGVFWASEINVFQKPQKAKKPKKKKKFKNGEKVVVYKGGTREYDAYYVGKNPLAGKGIHVLLVRGELMPRYVPEIFITKLNSK